MLPLRLAALLSLPAFLVTAQTATDTNEGVRLSTDPATGALQLSWWGRAGRIYFIEHSEDLQRWQALPTFEAGGDAPLGYGLSASATRLFARVRWVNATLGQFQVSDQDGDGLSNAAEAAAGLNPFTRDTDGDGLPDGWELAFGLDPFTADGASDLDSDGVRNDEDARPEDAGAELLQVTITAPAAGSAE